MTDYISTWQAVADDAVSVLMVRPAHWVDALEAGITIDDLPPGEWRKVWVPVMDAAAALQQPRALLDTEIASVTGVKVEWLAERVAAYDSWRQNSWEKTLEMLVKFGRGHRQYMALQQGAQQMRAALNNGLKIEEPARAVVTALQSEHVKPDQPTGLAALLVENKAQMEAEPQPGMSTGIALLDRWFGGGIGKNEFVADVAPYKSRKTSKMAHVLLTALSQGQRVNLFSFDERRANFIFRLEAMLMARYMWDRECWDHPLNDVSAKMIRQAGKRWRTWGDPLPKAFEYAFDTLSGYGKLLSIYDRATCDGTMATITGLCRIDASRRGLDMVFVDHLQSLQGYKRIFDKVEEGSDAFNSLRGELDCRLWLLSQQNEEAIKGGDAGSYSPNVKGGGGLASNADTIIVSRYRREPFPDPRVLKIELRQAREEESGVSDYVEIHPASGWITPRLDVVKTLNIQEELDKAIGPLD